MADVSISLLPATGGAARFAFSKTGPDRGLIDLARWRRTDTTGAPDDDLAAEVYDIRVSQAHTHVRAKSDHTFLLFTVVVTLDVDLVEAGGVTSLHLAYAPDPMGAGTLIYGVSPADVTRLKSFLAAAAFPVL